MLGTWALWHGPYVGVRRRPKLPDVADDAELTRFMRRYSTSAPDRDGIGNPASLVPGQV